MDKPPTNSSKAFAATRAITVGFAFV